MTKIRRVLATALTFTLLVWMGVGSAAPGLSLSPAVSIDTAAGLSPTSGTALDTGAGLSPMSGTAPTAFDDAYTTGAGQAITVPAPGVLGNDTDPESDVLTAYLGVIAGNGVVFLSPAGTFRYTPDAGFTGLDSFTYQTFDGTSFSGFATATVDVGSAPTPDPGPTPGPGTVDGAAIYASSCAGCHGASGEGLGSFPALVPTSLTSAQLVSVTNTGVGVMPGFGSLGVPKVAAVADYIILLSTGTAPPPPTPVPPSGPAAVYASFCASCHAADGSGTPLGPDIIGEGADETISVVRTGDGTMPGFPIAVISDADLADLADFVANLGGPAPPSPPAPTTPPDPDGGSPGDRTGPEVYAGFCASCHAADGTGTPLGPDVVGESIDEILDVVRSGDSGMPGFGAAVITDGELDAMAAWLAGEGNHDESEHDDDHLAVQRDDDHAVESNDEEEHD